MDSMSESEAGGSVAPQQPPVGAAMIQLLGGFQISQALYAVAALDIATQLDNGPRTIDELAATCGARPELVRRLVRSLAPLGVFHDLGDDTVETTPLGATLSAERPGSVRDIALYWMETHYHPFGELLHTVRTGETAAQRYLGQHFFDWIVATPGMAELQNRAMAAITSGLRDRMFDGYHLPAGDVVADIGGADGTILARLLESEPTRRGVLFDLPEVVPGAQKKIAEAGLTDRIAVVSGDFFESVPQADVYVLAAVLHDWDDESCVRILHSIKNAATSGARLVVIEGVVPAGDEPHATKLIDLIMLAINGGKERSATEFAALLASAGFTLDRIVPTADQYSFLEAHLP